MRILGIDPGFYVAGFSSGVTCMRKLVFTETRHPHFSLQCR